MKALFISHAVKDKPLVDLFIKLLEGGIGFTKDAIFCSSSEGQGIPSGADFGPYMRDRLRDADIVIALVSENYYASPFCLCETGGAWYGEKIFIPILTPPLKYPDLRGALYGKQVSLLDSPKDLAELYDRISGEVDGKPHGVSRFGLRKDEFLADLPAVLQKLEQPAGLGEEAAKRLTKERDDLKAEYRSLDDELRTAKEQIKALENAKDAKEVRRIKQEFSDEQSTFDNLVMAARAELSKLAAVVRLAAYYNYRDEALPYSNTEGQDCDDAIEEGFLTADSDEGVKLSEAHPKVARAIAALDELRGFMNDVEYNSESTFRVDYDTRTDDVFEFTNKNFWRENKLL